MPLYGDYTLANTSRYASLDLSGCTPYLTGSWVNINSTDADYITTNRTWSDLGYANIATSPLRFGPVKAKDCDELYEKLFGKRCEKEKDLEESPELNKYLEEFLVIKT